RDSLDREEAPPGTAGIAIVRWRRLADELDHVGETRKADRVDGAAVRGVHLIVRAALDRPRHVVAALEEVAGDRLSMTARVDDREVAAELVGPPHERERLGHVVQDA